MAEIGKIQAGGAARRAGKAAASRGGFSLGGASGVAAPEVGGSAGVGSVGLGLLAAQEQDSERQRDAQAKRRAEAMLEELLGLQRELLLGSNDPARLRRLAALGAGEAGADPVLREVVAAIALRARVELARRGWQDAAAHA